MDIRHGFNQPYYLFYLRVVQWVFAVIILGVAASNASDISSEGCAIPSAVGFNIAAAVFTLILLIPILLWTPFSASRPGLVQNVVPFRQFPQLLIDAVLFVFWISTAASSNVIDCFDDMDYRRTRRNMLSLLERSGSLRVGGGSSAGTAKKASKVAAKQGLDAVMVFFFFVSLAATSYFIRQSKSHPFAQSGGSSAPGEKINAASAPVGPSVGQQPGIWQQQGPGQQNYAQADPSYQPAPGQPGAAPYTYEAGRAQPDIEQQSGLAHPRASEMAGTSQTELPTET